MARFFLALCGLLLLAVFKWLFDHFLYDWFVQTIESVFGLKEADFEGTAARTPRAREGRQNGRSTRQPPSDPFRLVVSCKTRSVGPIDHALASEPPARRCRSWSCRRRGRFGAPSTDALHEPAATWHCQVPEIAPNQDGRLDQETSWSSNRSR